MRNKEIETMAQQNQQPTLQPQTSTDQPSNQPAKERRFLVEETAEIPRGGSSYVLSKGKTISSHGYDIAALKRQGVKLKDVSDGS
jgi:hypothetical protein